MRTAAEAPWVTEAFDAGQGALRWVTGAAVAAEGGLSWPETPTSELLVQETPTCDALVFDDLYYGTAGILVALTEARLSGISEFDEHARAAAARLRTLLSLSLDGDFAGTVGRPAAPEQPDLSLYTGLSGMVAALRSWALVSGDQAALGAATAAAGRIATLAATSRRDDQWLDLLQGEAGTLLVLAETGDGAALTAAAQIADRLVAQAWWIDGLPDWQPHTDAEFLMPGFSHGLAGIGYALGAAAGPLRRPDLLEVALLAGRRLDRLGRRPDGSLAPPQGIPTAAPQEQVSYGWCHGPTGTVRLFQLLDREQPGHGWGDRASACRQAVRRSGLPARRYPGFWDNLGQCCGTAGVGEMALDHYQETADPGWLTWAAFLARDVLRRRVADDAGVRWSHTEHRLSPPELPPAIGWMQGAAGIAGWLLRLVRVIRSGAGATVIWWPDRPLAC